MSIDDLLFGSIGAPVNISVPIPQSPDLVIPPSWLNVINAVRSQPSWLCSTIAGGALRDMDNGRPVKDVDIFVPHLGSNETALLAIQKAVPYAHIMEIEHNVHNTSQVGAAGISHFHFEVDGWKFEISQVTESFDHLSLLSRFDIGICMVSLDKNGAIARTPVYSLDKAQKLIRVVRATGGRELEHAERIKRKYQDWKVVPL